LAGWGVSHDAGAASDTSQRHKQQAPDSTAIMSLPEMIQKFDLSSVTHRRSVLDPMKLEYINKHHLMQTMSSDDGLNALAERMHVAIKEAFPSSPYTTIPYIKGVISVVQSRMSNLNDLPSLAQYLFVDPDYSTDEAGALRKTISSKTYLATVQTVEGRLRSINTAWHTVDFAGLLHEAIDEMKIKPKEFMTVLRHALTGCKNGPAVADIIRVLGMERTLARLVQGSAISEQTGGLH